MANIGLSKYIMSGSSVYGSDELQILIIYSYNIQAPKKSMVNFDDNVRSSTLLKSSVLYISYTISIV